jgi:hypothetical protein
MKLWSSIFSAYCTSKEGFDSGLPIKEMSSTLKLPSLISRSSQYGCVIVFEDGTTSVLLYEKFLLR